MAQVQVQEHGADDRMQAQCLEVRRPEEQVLADRLDGCLGYGDAGLDEKQHKQEEEYRDVAQNEASGEVTPSEEGI